MDRKGFIVLGFCFRKDKYQSAREFDCAKKKVMVSSILVYNDFDS